MNKSRLSIITFTSLVLLVVSLTPSASALGQKSKSRRPKPKTTPGVELIAEVEPQSLAENWKPFTSAQGHFSVVAPGELAYEKKVAQSPDGPIQVHVYNYFANAEYSVSYVDYLAVIEGTGRVTQFLDTVRDAGVKGINGRLLEEKEIMFAGHPSREYRVEYGTNNGFLLMGRYVVVGQRLYIVSTTYGKAATANMGTYEQWAKKFLDSFELVKETK
jgi:hypothetical protein